MDHPGLPGPDPLTTTTPPVTGGTTCSTQDLSHQQAQAQGGSSCSTNKNIDIDIDDDDKTLDAILDSLVIEDDHQWSVSSDDGDGGGGDPRQVEELLLSKLRRKDPNNNTDNNSLLPSPPGWDPARNQRDDDHEDDDDNSEGGQMASEVDQILSRAMDELNLKNLPTETSPSSPPPDQVTATFTPEEESNRPKDKGPDTTYPEPELSLPSVPQDDEDNNNNLPNLPATPQSLKDAAPTAATDLSLPQVPTILRDPVPPSSQPSQDPFESSIANRLAALKGPNHQPLVIDAFGLPSAPTFQPEDVKGGLHRPRSGYTDADQRTWCCVCLDDGTIRCLDCDDCGEVYCARCWREMHVGPAAGYDERGHQWEKFDPRPRQR